MNKTAKTANRKALLVLIAALALTGAASVQAQTIVDINSAGDTAIVSDIPTTNLEGNAAVIVGSNGFGGPGAEIGRGLFTFDLSSVPTNATITNATLEIAFTGNNGGPADTLSFYRMNTAWTASGTTWNTTNGSTPWPSGAGAAGDASTTASSSVTSGFQGSTSSAVYFNFTGAGLVSDVQNWVNGSVANDGWLFRDNVENDSNGKQYFLTSWSSFAAQPILEVQYTVAPEPGTDALFLGVAAAFGVLCMARQRRDRTLC